MNLTGNGGHGYIRLDWFTPDALPTWGDGRLLILGDKGFIEIRKYTDLAKSEKGNHLFLFVIHAPTRVAAANKAAVFAFIILK